MKEKACERHVLFRGATTGLRCAMVAPVGHALVEVHALSFRSWLSTDASTKAQSCPVAHREHAASSRINSHIGFGVHQCVRPCVPIKIFVVEFLSNFSSESNESTPRSCSLMVVRVQTNSMQIIYFSYLILGVFVVVLSRKHMLIEFIWGGRIESNLLLSGRKLKHRESILFGGEGSSSNRICQSSRILILEKLNQIKLNGRSRSNLTWHVHTGPTSPKQSTGAVV